MTRRQFLQATATGAVAISAPRATAQPADAWDDILAKMPAPLAALVNDDAHEIQLLYTRIDRDANGRVSLTKFPRGLAPRRWFSAASWVKLPAMLLAAERLTALGAGSSARIVLDQPPATGNWDPEEPLEETFARTVRRLAIVSENVPFNRLYEYLGPQEMADGLTRHGYPDARVIARLGSADPDANRRVGGSRVVGTDGRELERREARDATSLAPFPYGIVLKGRGWQNGDGTVTEGPHDFSRSNFLPLEAQHDMLAALVFPDAVPPAARWQMSAEHRSALLDACSRWPRESVDPTYDPATHPDGYAKFFVVGDTQEHAPASLRLFSKSGQAYGYLNDCAYVVDRDAGAEFLLAATIHVNADGIFNDDRYEYDTIGLPFLGALGRAVLDVERRRPRIYQADFSDLPR